LVALFVAIAFGVAASVVALSGRGFRVTAIFGLLAASALDVAFGRKRLIAELAELVGKIWNRRKGL
jgi:hypothetical protein